MNSKRKSLGKGLSSILGNNFMSQNSKKIKDTTSLTQNIKINQIQINPFQPRKNFNLEKINELAVSIEQLGLIQPITVRQLKADKYQLISGERRLRASKKLGLSKISAFIRIANDQEMLEMALVENIQRENLNPIEIAMSYKRLIDEIKLTQEKCSERVGKNRSTVTNFLRLLKLPLIIQKGLKEGVLSNGHARALLSIKSSETQINLFHDIVSYGYSVREVEQISKDFSNFKYTRISSSIKDFSDNLSFNQQKLIHDISQKIKKNVNVIKDKKGKGKVIIKFNNNNELNSLLENMNSKK